MDALLEASALPNLHPAIVHFPIALLPIAVLVDLVGRLGRLGRRFRRLEERLAWTTPAAVFLYCAAAVGAYAARFTGERAEDGLEGLAAAVQPHIAQHDDWAWYSALALTAVAVLALAGRLLARRARVGTVAGWSALGVAVLSLGLLARTADLGGALVFRHAVAIEQPTPFEPSTQTAAIDSHHDEHATDLEASAERRIARDEHGSIDWRPEPDDGGVLSGLLLGSADGLRATPMSASNGAAGLTLALDSTESVYLLFPDSLGDVEVRAWLRIESLDGSIGVVHHAASASSLGSFTLSSEGDAVLEEFRDGERNTLDSGTAPGPLTGEIEIAVSASGRHLKGLLGDRTLAHGHASELPGERAGLALSGHGSVVVQRVRVTRLGADDDHDHGDHPDHEDHDHDHDHGDHGH